MTDLRTATAFRAETSRKIARRLIPFLIVCYFISYLDRVNLGFAALTFRQDLSLSAEVFGLGAGIFFRLICKSGEDEVAQEDTRSEP